jgi:hypothetical protein
MHLQESPPRLLQLLLRLQGWLPQALASAVAVEVSNGVA